MSHLRIIREHERPVEGQSFKYHLRQHAQRMKQAMIEAQAGTSQNEPISFTRESRIRKPTGKRLVGYDVPWRYGMDPYGTPDPKIAK